MKLNNIKTLLALIIVSSLTITSCLKDKDFNNGSIQAVQGGNIQVIGTGVSATNSTNFLSLAVNNSDNDTVMNIVPVILSTANPAPQDIHVTLVQSDSLLTAYNDSNGTSFTVPPFTLVNPGGVVTIPKGSNTGYLQIKFKPSDYLGKSYAIGYIITSIAEKGYVISGNLNYAVVNVLTKNKYDGLYSLQIQSIGWAAYAMSDGPSLTWPSNVTFETASANSLIINAKEIGSAGLQFGFSPAGAANFALGGTKPTFVFDLTTNKLTDVYNANPDSRNRAFQLNPAVTDSRYDPVTKTVYAAYTMIQPSRPQTLYIYDTLVYKGSR